MGRLVPVFEEKDGRMLWQGKMKDEKSGRVGHLEIGHIGTDLTVGALADLKFFVDVVPPPSKTSGDSN